MAHGKTARLNELNAMLNLDKRENEIVESERGEEELSRSSDDRERRNDPHICSTALPPLQ